MKTIIFDFDGTIADSFGAIIKLGYQMTKNPKLKDPEVIAKIRNGSLTDVAKSLRIPYYRFVYLFIRGRFLMKDLMDEVKPYPGVLEAVKTLKSSGYDLFLLSSNKKQNIQKFLSRYDLESYFINTYSGIGLTGKKRALRKIIGANKLNPASTLYFANEPLDIEAARLNNIKCVATAWGYSSRLQLEESKPFAVIDKAEEIVAVARDWANEKSK